MNHWRHRKNFLSRQMSLSSHPRNPLNLRTSLSSHPRNPSSLRTSLSSHPRNPSSLRTSLSSHPRNPSSLRTSLSSHPRNPSSLRTSLSSHPRNPSSLRTSPSSHPRNPSSLRTSPSSHPRNPSSLRTSPSNHPRHRMIRNCRRAKAWEPRNRPTAEKFRRRSCNFREAAPRTALRKHPICELWFSCLLVYPRKLFKHTTGKRRNSLSILDARISRRVAFCIRHSSNGLIVRPEDIARNVPAHVSDEPASPPIWRD